MIFIDLKNVKEATLSFLQGKCKKSVITIGSIIRRCRLEKGYTLEELSKDICCVGFTSKLERNMIESINEAIVSKLCERLDLDYEKLMIATNGTLLSKALVYLIRDDIKGIEDICKDLERIPFPESDLLNAIRCIMTDNYVEFDACISRLDQIKHTLSPLEYASLLLVTIKYFIKTSQFLQAETYMTYLVSLDIDCPSIKTFIKESNFIISASLNKKEYLFYYEELKKEYDYTYPLKKLISNRLLFLRTIDDKKSLESIDSLEDDSVMLNSGIYSEFRYSKAYIYAKYAKYNETLNLIENINTKTNRDMALYAYALAKKMEEKAFTDEQKIEEKKKFYSLLKGIKHQNDDNIHVCMINLVEYLLDDTTKITIINLIKEHILPLFEIYQYPLYQDYIYILYLKLLGEQTKYKDAYLFSCKLNNI